MHPSSVSAVFLITAAVPQTLLWNKLFVLCLIKEKNAPGISPNMIKYRLIWPTERQKCVNESLQSRLDSIQIHENMAVCGFLKLVIRVKHWMWVDTWMQVEEPSVQKDVLRYLSSMSEAASDRRHGSRLSSRWIWSCVWCAAAGEKKTVCCCVTAVTTATTPSASSLLWSTCPKETGGAPSVWPRWRPTAASDHRAARWLLRPVRAFETSLSAT